MCKFITLCSLCLSPGSICKFPFLFLLIELYALLDVEFKLPTLPWWELVQFKFEDLIIVLIYAITDDAYDTSLLVGC